MFSNRLDRAKRLLKSKMRKHSIDNVNLISCLLDLVEKEQPMERSTASDIDDSSTKHMLKNSGKA